MTALIPAPLWRIIDKHTGQQVGTYYKNHVRAIRRRDRLDNEYGAYRYSVLAVYLPAETPNRGSIVDVKA